MIYYEHSRSGKKLTKILEKHQNLGHKLKSVVVSDFFTRCDLYFEDSETKYAYIHKCCHSAKKVATTIETYEKEGYKLVFHLVGGFTTTHELFFEKEIE